MRKILFIIMFILMIGSVSAAYYTTSPNSCLFTDPATYPGQDCTPQNICGVSSGIVQCYTNSLIGNPAANVTTTGTGGTDYTCTGTTCSGGFILDCYAAASGSPPYCTNAGSFICDRNATCYNKHVQTTCLLGSFASSTCADSCTTNYFTCDGSRIDTNGCEILAGASCGFSTGTIVNGQCYNTTQGNCTASTRYDCNNDDSDNNIATCNGNSDGCEITLGGACTVGSLTGTYAAGCNGAVGNCVVTRSNFQTGTNTQYATNATESLLHGTDYGTGLLMNLSNNGTGKSFIINASGCVIWPDGTTQCNSSSGTSGGDGNYSQYTNVSNLNVNTTTLKTTGGLLDIVLSFFTDLFYQKSEVYNKTEIDNRAFLNQTQTDVLYYNRTDIDAQQLAQNNTINLKMNITDQRYNDTAAIELKMNITDQRYNETAIMWRLSDNQVNITGNKTGSFNINTTGYINANNITSNGYIKGQPINGMLGSGIISGDFISYNAKLNISCVGLVCSYPSFIMRLVSTTQDIKYCNISNSTLTATNNAHNVFYVDNDCVVRSTTIESWYNTILETGGQWDFANMVCYEDNCTIIHGTGIEQQRMLYDRKINFNRNHLAVTFGMTKDPGDFPNITFLQGKYIYLDDVIITSNQIIGGNDSTNSTYLITFNNTEYVVTPESTLNFTSCQDELNVTDCSNITNWRRIYLFVGGWYNPTDLSDSTKTYQILPSETEQFASESACLDTVVSPISYVLPEFYTNAIAPTWAYCIRPNDTTWSSSGWIDLRTLKVDSATISGAGSGVPYIGALRDLNMGSYDVIAANVKANINASYVQNSPWLVSTDQRYNDTLNIEWDNLNNKPFNTLNTSQIINGSGGLSINDTYFNTKVSYDNFTWYNLGNKIFDYVNETQFSISDISGELYLIINETFWATKLDVTDQRYNDTAAIDLKLNITDQRYNESGRIDILNSTKLQNGSSANLSSLYVVDNITAKYYYGDGRYLSGINGTSSGSSNMSVFVNKTVTTYTANFSSGDLRGYVAANAICNDLISDSHICSFAEMSYSISSVNLESGDWVGEAWITTGPAKYSPADLPVNDCNGFKQGVAGSYLGNWWVFNSTNGGVGATGHCGNSISIACCK